MSAAVTVGAAVRPARPDDVPRIVGFIRELASYERLAHEAVADEADLARALFGPNPRVFALIAEWEGEPAGFALYFYSFSTFLGRHGLYLEDLYVRPEHRGRGLGRAMLAALARQAVAEGCGRLEWSVLDWNEPALRFYRSLGAVPLAEWTVQRLTGEPLQRLAGS